VELFQRVTALLLSALVIPTPMLGQQNAGTAQALTAQSVLQQSLATLVGNQSVTDMTLTGSARRIAGSDDETGTVTLKVLSSGATRLDFNFPSGPRSEFKSFDTGIPFGSWSGPDGVFHPISNHNLVNDWGWSPAFALAPYLNPQNFAVSFVATETRNGQAIIHLTSAQKFPDLPPDAAVLMQHLSQMDIVLDASTFLPSSIAYNIHPDNNELLDIPVVLQFSDYQTVNGVQIPFHLQKLINNTLALDVRFQTVTLNSGITSDQVGAQ